MLVMLLASVGCNSLKPIELPDESAVAPVENTLWNAMGEQRSENWFHLLDDGAASLEWRIRTIQSATESIDLQTFLWKEDGVGLMLFREILEAADRGVAVRVLLDDTFTINENDLLYTLAQHPRIECRIYNPFQRRSDHLALRQLMNLGEFSRLDHRMHNKVMIADNRVAIVGGRNLADEYFGRHASANFRDMETLCAGTLVQEMSHSFDVYWNNEWSFPVDRILNRPTEFQGLDALREWLNGNAASELEETPAERQRKWSAVVTAAASGEARLLFDEPAHINPASDLDEPNQLAGKLISWMDGASNELTAVSAYLIPTPQLIAAIERAEQRGMRVRILTNSLRSNNHMSAHGAYRHYMGELLDLGVELHEVRARAKDRAYYMQTPVEDKLLGLHAKLLVRDDDQVFIGSANLDPRSLRLNTEMGLLITSKELNRQLRAALETNFDMRNAWRVRRDEKGRMIWEGNDLTLDKQPADSEFQRLEDWFLGELPVGDKL